jgi:hypothetical protein
MEKTFEHNKNPSVPNDENDEVKEKQQYTKEALPPFLVSGITSKPPRK